MGDERDAGGGLPRGPGERTAPPVHESLLGGVHAAALVLACVFLASAAVRREVHSLAFGAALLALSGGAWFLAGWLTDERADTPGWRRVRGGLLVVAAGVAASLAVRGAAFVRQLSGSRATAEGFEPALKRAPAARLLLVTVGAGSPAGPLAVPAALAMTAGFHASPRRDPALASVLTGLEVIEHRVLFEGDDLPRRARTVLEAFGEAGAAVAAFGCEELPRWVTRGAARDPSSGGVSEALHWLARADAACALAVVHVQDPAALETAALATFAEGRDTFAVVVELPALRSRMGEKAEAVPELPREDCTGLLAFGPLGSPAGRLDGLGLDGGRGAVTVPATLLGAAGLDALPPEAHPRAAFDVPRAGELVAVTFRHGRTGAVHAARGFSAFGEFSAVLTPLGGFQLESQGPRARLDDWRADGALDGHFVYRNRVRAEGGAGAVADFVAAFARWRERNSGFEVRPSAAWTGR